jgi:7,8-dihydropterin-6-yl-methyl-4-(beta-D-ribofuranosyl)aminobenzene 5'-phosphate synthase
MRVGGLHLTGGLYEEIIPRTVDALSAIGPDVVVPGHCTGWKATNLIVSRLPQAYIQSNAGTRLHFAGAPAREGAAATSVAKGRH